MELSIQQLKELLGGPSEPAKCGGNGTFFEVGEEYLIRTVTMHFTGRVVAVNDSEVMLDFAAWIADTGRFHDALRDGSLAEVEPYVGPVVVSRGAIIDYTKWGHDLPTKQK